MDEPKASESSTTEGLPVVPSLKPALDALRLPRTAAVPSMRVALIALLALLLGLASGGLHAL